jgi:hypothetical protein
MKVVAVDVHTSITAQSNNKTIITNKFLHAIYIFQEALEKWICNFYHVEGPAQVSKQLRLGVLWIMVCGVVCPARDCFPHSDPIVDNVRY